MNNMNPGDFMHLILLIRQQTEDRVWYLKNSRNSTEVSHVVWILWGAFNALPLEFACHHLRFRFLRLWSDVHQSQDTRFDRSAASSSPWPCLELSVTSCFSLCLLFSLFQKGPAAPAIAVTAPQQTPMVMTPQATAQAASQPVQPVQTGIAAAPGASVVSQVRSLLHCCS